MSYQKGDLVLDGQRAVAEDGAAEAAGAAEAEGALGGARDAGSSAQVAEVAEVPAEVVAAEAAEAVGAEAAAEEAGQGAGEAVPCAGAAGEDRDLPARLHRLGAVVRRAIEPIAERAGEEALIGLSLPEVVRLLDGVRTVLDAREHAVREGRVHVGAAAEHAGREGLNRESAVSEAVRDDPTTEGHLELLPAERVVLRKRRQLAGEGARRELGRVEAPQSVRTVALGAGSGRVQLRHRERAREVAAEKPCEAAGAEAGGGALEVVVQLVQTSETASFLEAAHDHAGVEAEG